MRFIKGTDYRQEFSIAVTEIIALNIVDRQERMKAVRTLVSIYIEDIGETPELAQLERLTNYILREELTDSHPDKMTTNEYPIMSEYQLARRQFGAHKEKDPNTRIEIPLSDVVSVGTDGKDYRYPSRRRRTLDEMIWLDEHTKSRNKERHRKYNDFRYGKLVDTSHVYANGVFMVNVTTGKKIIFDKEKYLEMFPWELNGDGIVTQQSE